MENKNTRAEILAAAESVVCGDRDDIYGGPEDSFRRIAALWMAYMRGRCVGNDADLCIEAEDVAIMMALLKIARLAAAPMHRDSWVDLAGYAACGGEAALR